MRSVGLPVPSRAVAPLPEGRHTSQRLASPRPPPAITAPSGGAEARGLPGVVVPPPAAPRSHRALRTTSPRGRCGEGSEPWARQNGGGGAGLWWGLAPGVAARLGGTPPCYCPHRCPCPRYCRCPSPPPPAGRRP